MENNTSFGRLGAAFLIGLGLTLGGFFPGYYYYQAKMNANSVSVKGLAEMDVRADLAVWDIKYTVTNNDLTAAGARMAEQKKVILDY